MNDNLTYPKFYTPEQVAKILQLSKNTVYQLIHKGEITAKKIGKVYRIPADALSNVYDQGVIVYPAKVKDKEEYRKILLSIKGDWFDNAEFKRNRRKLKKRLSQNSL